MTSNQIARMIAQLEAQLTTLRNAQELFAAFEGQTAKQSFPAKLRKAKTLRAPATAPAPQFKTGAAHVLAVVQQLAAAGTPITSRAIKQAGVPLTINGISSALWRAGYKNRDRVWRLPKAKQAKLAKTTLKRNGKVKKGDTAHVLAALLKAAGKPLQYDELKSAAATAGVRMRPQNVGAACRYGYLKRDGDVYALGPNGASAEA